MKLCSDGDDGMGDRDPYPEWERSVAAVGSGCQCDSGDVDGGDHEEVEAEGIEIPSCRQAGE